MTDEQPVRSTEPSVRALAAGLDVARPLALLQRMVRFDSRTETPGEVQLAKWLVDYMTELGLDAWLDEVSPGRYNAIGVFKGSGRDLPGAASLLFNGHIDTNPATEGWTVDPWGAHTTDEVIYGLGVSNMKAGCASYLSAVEALLRGGFRPAADVTLTFVVGELQGGLGTVKMIEHGVRAEYFINCEPTDVQALTLHAGAFNFTVELTGVTRHLSKREESVDAIVAACALVPRLNALTFSGAADERHAEVNRCNVGVIHGALGRTLEEWRPPQIADFVRLVGTGRYAPSQSVESVLADLRRELDRLESEFPGLRAEVFPQEKVTDRPDMPPFEVSADSRIVRTLNSAYAAVRGAAQPTGAIKPCCFFGSDAAHLSKAGMEGIVCGPGGKYNTMPDERVELVDYYDLIRMHMLAIEEVCGRGN
ncbi:M20/M25/M40 family metallo-hydrolase [Micromonospora sp. NPDC007271]|uniref:M20 family metallopeptidase n=1 Tax=Micromonospora sp. NPDC007271 TaxID=3154587 RepID=UPI0034081270